MSFVSVQGLVKSFQDRKVLAGVSLQAERGDTIAVAGPSGSGKSTLLNIIGGLLPADDGEVVIDGVDVTQMTPPDLAKYRARCVGFVFQDHHLLPQLTLVENVMLPALAAGLVADHGRAMGLLEQVGLGARAHAFPWQTSGGERQRAALARALMNRPKLLLCDEPTGNLDQATGNEVIRLLLDIAASDTAERVAVLMATHNVDHARRFARRLRLDSGLLVEGA